MSSPASFRTRTAYLTNAQFEALSAIAAVEGHDCADSCLEALLGPILAKRAALPWLIERTRSDREARKRDYAAKLLPAQPEDQLP